MYRVIMVIRKYINSCYVLVYFVFKVGFFFYLNVIVFFMVYILDFIRGFYDYMFFFFSVWFDL